MSEQPEPLVGDVLDGRYRLMSQVGQGGMARVFRAEDTALGRTVAVKVLRPGVEGVSSAERARSEVTLLASLNHPSLVTLFDAQLTDDRTDYLVMEFVDGPTLTDRIDEGPMDAAEVAGLAAELAEALAVVHAAGVVHRDVKPSNVLLAPPHLPTGRHRAKLADFGIALLLDSARLTEPGSIIGTAAYLAPEQVRGADPAPPADVYALGLVLLEALTGQRAYPNTDGVGAALARLTTPPEVPAALGADWVTLLERMTATAAADRPTALEVAGAAERLRDSASTASTAPASTVPASTAGASSVGTVPPLPALPAAVAAAAPDDHVAAVTPVAGIAPAGRASAETGPTRVFTGAVTAGAVAEDRPRSRRPLAIVLAVAAVAVIAAVSLWTANLAGAPAPASTDPAPTEQADPAPTEQSSTPSVAPVDDQQVSDEQADDEKATKEAEKAAEDARKRAEKEAEKAAKEAERENAGPGKKDDKP
ncbi:protein kinase [Microbacterium sp. EYE_5]|uniref:serine/threonine-protein kinase n=1 Tax=unclassified Microbacterium TaxID=2609290 RepID=UPI0020044260|nr:MULTISPECIES: serine/threonine-protein kinase [unclassified Microbacterium]MCK6079337.1 protein kinase [Microbacterium sp. EYE_382]MCK6084607.1 protein kinase [Microbacterium sp. EYE_384]MCK6123164.1 protein kinase [Microbacterium sp. EYE_80]MCK6125371.1 protein kinase [Microbacterium sp. EYE_79]MCK6140291.1 protein kinase [Microbacterium sp. EYE_39]